MFTIKVPIGKFSELTLSASTAMRYLPNEPAAPPRPTASIFTIFIVFPNPAELDIPLVIEADLQILKIFFVFV